MTRALQIVRVLERAAGGKRLAELSVELGLHKTTVLRLLRALAAEGMVSREPGGRTYVLSPAFWLHSPTLLHPARSLVTAVQELLEGLAAHAQATAVMVLADGSRGRAVAPMCAFPSTPVYLDPSRGESVPLHASAAGKCYLSALSDDELSVYIERGLARLTEFTVTSERELKAELALVRRQGYALNRGEAIRDSPGLAVPLREDSNVVVGGVAVAFAGVRLPDDALRQHLAPVRETAGAVSELLGDESWTVSVGHVELDTTAISAVAEPSAAGLYRGAPPVVNTVARAARLVDLLVRSPQGGSLTELARRQALDKVTVLRLLQTLAVEGLVRKDAASGRYRIHPLQWIRLARFLGFAPAMPHSIDSVLRWLADAAGVTACLIFPDEERARAVIVRHALPNLPLCFHPEQSPSSPLHSSAAGKCYLAWQSDDAVAAYVERGLEPTTEHTITSPRRLRSELGTIRRQGYAVSAEESFEGVGGLAVPLTDDSGEVVASLAVVPLIAGLTESKAKRWVEQLRDAASRISWLLRAEWRD